MGWTEHGLGAVLTAMTMNPLLVFAWGRALAKAYTEMNSSNPVRDNPTRQGPFWIVSILLMRKPRRRSPLPAVTQLVSGSGPQPLQPGWRGRDLFF